MYRYTPRCSCHSIGIVGWAICVTPPTSWGRCSSGPGFTEWRSRGPSPWACSTPDQRIPSHFREYHRHRQKLSTLQRVLGCRHQCIQERPLGLRTEGLKRIRIRGGTERPEGGSISSRSNGSWCWVGWKLRRRGRGDNIGRFISWYTSCLYPPSATFPCRLVLAFATLCCWVDLRRGSPLFISITWTRLVLPGSLRCWPTAIILDLTFPNEQVLWNMPKCMFTTGETWWQV